MGDNSHDYSIPPATNGKVLTDHLNKLIDLIHVIDEVNVTKVNNNDRLILATLTGLNNRLTTLESKNKYDTSSSCGAFLYRVMCYYLFW